LAWSAAALIAGCHSGKSPSGGSGTTAAPATVAICAASDLKFALDDLLGDFSKLEPNVAVTATYGSSGNFYQQLKQRAPFDVYLSADIEYVRKLNHEALIVPGSLFRYAEGRLVVWVRNESKLALDDDGKSALADASVNKIAVANPQTAPYGRAAVAALKTFGLYEQLESKLVQGENIAQTAQYVESGAADIGLIALSLATAPAMKDKGRYIALPKAAYPKLEQAGAVLSWAKSPEAAEKFCAFLRSAGAREKLRQYGFTTPEE
jgi:molybdate transport system substrate-binding protein